MIYNDNLITYPLTNPQKRIWYLDTINSNSPIWNIGGGVRVKEKLDFNLLENAINILLKKNQALRMNFIFINDELFQFVDEYKHLKVDTFTFNSYREFSEWLNNDFSKGITLSSNKLFYFAICNVKENETFVYLKMHHIISDGWSFYLLAKQLCEIYNELLNNSCINDYVEHFYVDYINSEKNYINSSRYKKDKKYWIDKFEILPENLYNNKWIGIDGKRKVYNLSLDKSRRIKEFVKQYKCSLNTFFISAYLIYINKIHQREDIVLGTPVMNRSSKTERSTVGMFTGTMPLRYKIDVQSTIEELIKGVNSEFINGFKHQKYPYNDLVQELELSKHGYDSLFKEYINYYNTNFDFNINGKEIEGIELYSGVQAYPFQLIIKEWSEEKGLTLSFDYITSEYDEEDIESMYLHINTIIDEILNRPKESIKNVNVVTTDERKLLYKLNKSESCYPKEKTICELFEAQVENIPYNIALSFEGNNITYEELNNKANQLARIMRNRGINNKSKVGIITKHSFETVISILAVIKAGAAYVPIDRTYPVDRINYMIKDSQMSLILTNCEIDSKITFDGEYIDLNNKEIFVGDTSNLGRNCSPDDLVYIIYTSGTTGRPKGVMIEHRGLVNYIWWAKKMYINAESEVFALYSSIAFDLTVTSIFTPLISGNRMFIYYDDGSEFILYKILKENVANIIKLTPSHLSLLNNMNNSKSSVKRFIVGGENLKCDLAAKAYESFDKSIEIFNEYGPTETVVGCMIYKYDFNVDKKGSVPIGIPGDNVHVYVLDKHHNMLPLETIGELYISGDGLARGYLNDDKKTRSAFVRNPFNEGKLMYKTGDAVRVRRDGNLEFVGRMDRQVKIRGHRVELGEIERQLLDINGISEAVVTDYQDEKGDKKLCAYVVNNNEISNSQIKKELNKSLPSYMVPTYIETIDKVPLTSNGKVNFKLLLLPKNNDNSGQDIIGPTNNLEEKLIKISKEILNLNSISMTDNFYELRGDSIKAIQIATKLKSEGLSLKIKDILHQNSFEEIAACIQVGNNNDADQSLSEGEFDNTPITAWFFEEDFNNYNYFNQSILLRINSSVNNQVIENTLNIILKHHDSLRINFNSITKKLYYNNEYLNNKLCVQVFNLSNINSLSQKEEIHKIGGKIKSGLNIEEDILFKACIFELGDENRLLLLTAHHLLIDGISWRIILEDLNILVRQHLETKDLKLPLKTCSTMKWVEKLKNYSENISEEEKEYWNYVLSKQKKYKIDLDLGVDSFSTCVTLETSFTSEETQDILTITNEAYGIKTDELLIIALAISVSKLTNDNSVTIQLEGHGREEIFDDVDISRTVGWFTSMYPVNFEIEDTDLSTKIKLLKEQIRNIPSKGLNYGILRYITNELSIKEKKMIRLNYLGDFSNSIDGRFFDIAYEDTGAECCLENNMTCLIEVVGIILDGKLNISVKYSENKFKNETMRVFIDDFHNGIREIITHCNNKKNKEFTPSDFDAAELSQDDLDNLFM